MTKTSPTHYHPCNSGTGCANYAIHPVPPHLIDAIVTAYQHLTTQTPAPDWTGYDTSRTHLYEACQALTDHHEARTR